MVTGLINTLTCTLYPLVTPLSYLLSETFYSIIITDKGVTTLLGTSGILQKVIVSLPDASLTTLIYENGRGESNLTSPHTENIHKEIP